MRSQGGLLLAGQDSAPTSLNKKRKSQGVIKTEHFRKEDFENARKSSNNAAYQPLVTIEVNNSIQKTVDRPSQKVIRIKRSQINHS